MFSIIVNRNPAPAPTVLRAPDSETTTDVTLTSGTAAFGSFVEMLDETTLTCNYLTIFIHNPNTGNKYEIEFAVGSAGSEDVKIEGILHHVDLVGQNIITTAVNFKVELPKGVRISARCKATNNTDTIKIKGILQGIT